MSRTTPDQTQIAEFNYGRLRHDWDDPRIAEFADGLEAVYAIAARSPGFVWMMSPEAMEREQLDADGVFGGDPRIASTLSVWRDVASLKRFVFDTLHGRFFKRGHLWFERLSTPNFVMWPVPAGHRPSMREAMRRMRQLSETGASDAAFDWSWLERQLGADAPSHQQG